MISSYALTRSVFALFALAAAARPSAAEGLDAGSVVHPIMRAADGRPCLSYRTESRPDSVMKNTYGHIVHVTNACPRQIVVAICYKGDRRHCSRLKLNAYGEDAAFLGSVFNQPLFAFDHEEEEAR